MAVPTYEQAWYGSGGNMTPEKYNATYGGSSSSSSSSSGGSSGGYSSPSSSSNGGSSSSSSSGSSSTASTSYGGYSTPDLYAAAIKRVIADGGQFQDPVAAGAFMSKNPQYGWSAPGANTTASPTKSYLPVKPTQPAPVAPVVQPVQPVAPKVSTPYGGYKTEQEYVDAIKRVIAAGGQFQRPEEASAYISAHPGLFSPAQPIAQPKPVVQPTQPTQPITQPTQSTQPATQGGFPYEQFMKDLLDRFSQYKTPTDQDILTRAQQAAQLQTNPVLADIVNRLSSAQTSAANQKGAIEAAYTGAVQSPTDILTQAQQYASLQVNPVLNDIVSRLNSAKTTANNRKGETEAAYSGVAQQTQARLAEARKAALESAISRNMGRSGVVETLTGQFTTPIMLEEQRLGQEKAAKLASIANEYANTEDEIGRLRTQAESQRGLLESTKSGELQREQQRISQEKTSKLSAIANELANTEAELGRLRTQTEQQRGLIESTQTSALRDQIQQWMADQQAQEWQRAIDLSKLGIGWQDMLNSQVPTYQW